MALARRRDHEIDLRCGRWQDVLAGVTCDTLITDPPYGPRTHAGARSATGVEGIDYACLTPAGVREIVQSWAPRTRRWVVAITSHDLIPTWEAEYADAGLYGFAPVPVIVSGMGVRMQGDGPASWGLYVMTARHRTRAAMCAAEGALWRALPGGYWGPATGESSGGRGKPAWLMGALVRDYSDSGDLVCDPYAGWGSTLTAAIAAGRRVVGAEVDREVFEIAEERCATPLQVDLL